jgi:nucleotide-binding universal stress UspA family protein
MIVLTSHGRTGPGRWLFGSVTEEIVAGSEVPVLVERAEQAARAARPGLRLTPRPRLLVPLDGSTFAEGVLPRAAQLASDLGGALDLVRVAKRPRDVVDSADGSVVGYVDQLQEALRTRSLAYPGGIRQRLLERWPELPVQIGVRLGEPAPEITAAALADYAALIVMATHGLTGLRRSVVGSVAGRLLQQDQVPLVLVQGPRRTTRRQQRQRNRPAYRSSCPCSDGTTLPSNLARSGRGATRRAEAAGA